MERPHDDVQLSDQELALVCGGLTRAWPGAWNQPEDWKPTGGTEPPATAPSEAVLTPQILRRVRRSFVLGEE